MYSIHGYSPCSYGRTIGCIGLKHKISISKLIWKAQCQHSQLHLVRVDYYCVIRMMVLHCYNIVTLCLLSQVPRRNNIMCVQCCQTYAPFHFLGQSLPAQRGGYNCRSSLLMHLQQNLISDLVLLVSHLVIKPSLHKFLTETPCTYLPDINFLTGHI